jgi:hypothetical protein
MLLKLMFSKCAVDNIAAWGILYSLLRQFLIREYVKWNWTESDQLFDAINIP